MSLRITFTNYSFNLNCTMQFSIWGYQFGLIFLLSRKEPRSVSFTSRSIFKKLFQVAHSTSKGCIVGSGSSFYAWKLGLRPYPKSLSTEMWYWNVLFLMYGLVWCWDYAGTVLVYCLLSLIGNQDTGIVLLLVVYPVQVNHVLLSHEGCCCLGKTPGSPVWGIQDADCWVFVAS